MILCILVGFARHGSVEGGFATDVTVLDGCIPFTEGVGCGVFVATAGAEVLEHGVDIPESDLLVSIGRSPFQLVLTEEYPSEGPGTEGYELEKLPYGALGERTVLGNGGGRVVGAVSGPPSSPPG